MIPKAVTARRASPTRSRSRCVRSLPRLWTWLASLRIPSTSIFGQRRRARLQTWAAARFTTTTLARTEPDLRSAAIGAIRRTGRAVSTPIRQLASAGVVWLSCPLRRAHRQRPARELAGW